MKTKREFIIVGDRVLIEPDEKIDKTSAGLFLPPTVKEKDKVLAGRIIKVGPGYPVHDPSLVLEEPWKQTNTESIKYIPLQAREGDYALFLKDAGIEIEFEEKKYLIVPHSAILVLIRTTIIEDEDDRGF
ncbi:MAG TPA: co-chaperone GroES family protein [Thermodesulfovibrio thiophilus]|uniref:co-chaperone GroES n=1 Tax=Thermodesulfovibrio thiophilus TaxID=340095 RepID=UPI0004037C6C|nr:co-chaperone GroES family protein [Thermodesulfovibrio thiophilus]HHW20788.1 co-chaperone GroES [Thermodesulfovibrio thiophilus]HOA83351.1 co-chaperone GroES family protein [Thermodesulfovibrio thiophilus]HQA04450.1 co-chaperone GroES family protein [Thermodesulfovibrio thiophilus]HQD36631.1 co-chaperone GroES family protein [Thermodesulfovibrio thiophilus]